ncbi:M50 family metallopeptidase [Schaalia vaccimaxillae]|uniref:M50 family metallopeptidase n=1 Tax=Schaalia vaccimaxillae TaxID=183916 RepID=UPI0003B5BA2B|nr:site-2 protease family protein [Schaalia vaccimaxillae]
MDSLWGIAFIIVGLMASVALHEVGHMIPAKKFGVLVPEYAVGFGPALLKKKVGETLYALRVVLLGGYVKIVGMYPPARPGTRLTNSKGQPTLAQEARVAAAQEIPAGQEHRAFYYLSAPRKIIVMACGPLMNLLICILLTSITMIGIGSATPTLTLSQVAPTILSAEGEVPSPADQAGLKAGDTIVSVNGQRFDSWTQFQQTVAASSDEELEVVIRRDGTELPKRLTPAQSEDGRSIIGVSAGREYVSATFGDVLEANWRMFTGTASVVVRLPQAVWDVGVALFTDQERDSGGVVSIVGVGRLAGEVTGDSEAIGLVDTRQTVALLLSLLASLNMALFVFNLIPLPPLDGGHILGAIWEGLRRKASALTGRSDRGPADIARLVPLTWTVGALLTAMSVLLIVADLFDPISLS